MHGGYYYSCGVLLLTLVLMPVVILLALLRLNMARAWWI
jgi:hypothetical protein